VDGYDTGHTVDARRKMPIDTWNNALVAELIAGG
jgi:hypothetical protein